VRETHPEAGLLKSSLLLRVGFVVAGIAGVLGLASMTVISVLKIRAGRGLESYRTIWLVDDNSVAFLVFIATLGLALVIGLCAVLVGWQRNRREVGALEQKYGHGEDRA
jgi:hypothetical protein